jgi:hypothetical protein
MPLLHATHTHPRMHACKSPAVLQSGNPASVEALEGLDPGLEIADVPAPHHDSTNSGGVLDRAKHALRDAADKVASDPTVGAMGSRCGTPGEALTKDCQGVGHKLAKGLKRAVGAGSDAAHDAADAAVNTGAAAADAASEQSHATRRLAAKTADAAADKAAAGGAAVGGAAAGAGAAYDSVKGAAEGTADSLHDAASAGRGAAASAQQAVQDKAADATEAAAAAGEHAADSSKGVWQANKQKLSHAFTAGQEKADEACATAAAAADSAKEGAADTARSAYDSTREVAEGAADSAASAQQAVQDKAADAAEAAAAAGEHAADSSKGMWQATKQKLSHPFTAGQEKADEARATAAATADSTKEGAAAAQETAADAAQAAYNKAAAAGNTAAASGHEGAAKGAGLLGKVTDALSSALKGTAADQHQAVSCVFGLRNCRPCILSGQFRLRPLRALQCTGNCQQLLCPLPSHHLQCLTHCRASRLARLSVTRQRLPSRLEQRQRRPTTLASSTLPRMRWVSCRTRQLASMRRPRPRQPRESCEYAGRKRAGWQCFVALLVWRCWVLVAAACSQQP